MQLIRIDMDGDEEDGYDGMGEVPEAAIGAADDAEDDDDSSDGDDGDDAECDPAHAPLTAEDLLEDAAAADAYPAVRAIYILPAEFRRTPNDLTDLETAQCIALGADMISRDGTMLGPDETDRFPPAQFNVMAARRELELGMLPFNIRRELARLPTGEVVCDSIPVNEMLLPHLANV